MPRHARHVLPGVPMHVMQRAVNSQTCFPEPGDRDLYVRLVEEAVDESACRVHAYVVMTNHVHLLVTPEREDSPGALMKRVGQIYTQYFNRKYQRRGALWGSRPKMCQVHDSDYLMICYRYIELNPVRAGLAWDPVTYAWSSYAANAFGAPSWISPHPTYIALGEGVPDRTGTYRSFVNEGTTLAELQAIRIAIRNQSPFGDREFVERVQASRRLRTEPHGVEE